MCICSFEFQLTENYKTNEIIATLPYAGDTPSYMGFAVALLSSVTPIVATIITDGTQMKMQSNYTIPSGAILRGGLVYFEK